MSKETEGRQIVSMRLLATALNADDTTAPGEVPDAATRVVCDVIAALPEPIVVLDQDGCVVLWNPAAEGLYGWPEVDVLGRPAPFLSETDRVNLAGRLNAGARLDQVESQHRARDGGERIVLVSGARLPHAPTLHVLTLTDVTSQRHSAAQNQRVERMGLITRLAGGVAHDFNNMLTTIAGFAQLLVSDDSLTPEQRTNVTEILKAARRSSHVTRQLLAYSRQQVHHPKALRLNAVVTSLLPVLRDQLGPGFSLDAVLADELPHIRADRSQLEQVLLNLVRNARDAQSDGGAVYIRTGTHEHDGASDVTGLEPGSYVTLSVRDEGTGIAPDVLPHVFEPFFTTNPTFEASGLGLATVEGVVQQNGGTIAVHTAVGAGTEFVVYLPVAATAEEVEATHTAGPARGRMPTVLVAEDEESVRRLLIKVLERSGFNVLSSASAEEAIHAYEQHDGAVDLLLSDVVMPGMSGVELADRLSASAPDLRVLLVSGHSREAFGPTNDAAGRHFLEKPFDPAVLVERVRAILR